MLHAQSSEVRKQIQWNSGLLEAMMYDVQCFEPEERPDFLRINCD